MGVNKAIIIGNLGADPEEIAGGDGCRFSVATNEKWTDKSGQKQERTEWHQIVAWDRTAENCLKYLTKGRQVYLEGKIYTEKWQDDDGNDRYSTKIRAYNVTFLSGGDDGGGSRGRSKKKKRRSSGGGKKRRGFGKPKTESSYDDDDIPF